MTMDEYRAELRSRVAYLKNLYVQNKIKLKAGEGLCADLEVANALTQTGGTPRRDQANAAHVVWNLVEVIRPCVEAGLDVSNHLANITTGTTDYGVPADPNSKKRFYKDFEFELLITSSLIKKGLVPQLLGNDPRGELLIGNVFIEAKHPNKVSGIEKHMNKFVSVWWIIWKNIQRIMRTFYRMKIMWKHCVKKANGTMMQWML